MTSVLAGRLGGTGRIADDLYLMAHHDRSGKPYLQPRAAGLGLSGALLAELLLAGTIEIWPDALVVTGLVSPREELAVSAAELLRERQQFPVRDWLSFLARTAAGDVARRLGQSGYLVPAAARPWRGQRWVPVDADCAFAPVARAQSALREPGPAGVETVAVAGLADACGLGWRLWPYAPPQGRQFLAEAVGGLDHGLREVIAQTQVAVDSAVLAHRT